MNPFANHEPKTWVCQCGQVNLWTDRVCRACNEQSEIAWDPHDPQRPPSGFQVRKPRGPK